MGRTSKLFGSTFHSIAVVAVVRATCMCGALATIGRESCVLEEQEAEAKGNLLGITEEWKTIFC